MTVAFKVICGRREDRLASLRDELVAKGAKVHTLRFDVGDYKAVESAIKSLPSEFAAVDVLVNNAGLALGMDKAWEGSIDDWNVMIDTNIRGVVRLFFT